MDLHLVFILGIIVIFFCILLAFSGKGVMGLIKRVQYYALGVVLIMAVIVDLFDVDL